MVINLEKDHETRTVVAQVASLKKLLDKLDFEFAEIRNDFAEEELNRVIGKTATTLNRPIEVVRELFLDITGRLRVYR